MHNFAYAQAPDVAAAITAAVQDSAAFLAGGTELLNWLKLGIQTPERVIDITGLPLRGIEQTDRGLRIGALTTLNECGEHETVRRDFPVLAQAALKAASAQLRNMATLGGNVLQKTRCAYFRAEPAVPCNKRKPGSGCPARDGDNSRHAIFGWSEACVATQPSDPAVALAALDAVIHVQGPAGARAIPAADFHRLPGAEPDEDNVLAPGELITAFEIPASPSARRSFYLKVRERESYEYAVVSVAATLELDGSRIKSARIALGGVAHKPWRLSAAEQALQGVALEPDTLQAAVGPAFAEARPLAHNAFKIGLAQRAVVRALEHAGGLL